MDKDDIRWLKLLDVLRGVRVISMCRKTDILNGEFHFDGLIIYNQRLGTVHDLLGEGSFHTVAGENNSILGVWSPFHEELSALPVL